MTPKTIEPKSLSITVTQAYLTIFEIFDVNDIFFIGAMVKINYTSGLTETSIPLFYQKIGDHISWDATTMASLVMIGGRLRLVERSTRFV